ncbi:unnamed protein product [Gemmataceae bacterium]|nr:unnamed protein product [Gemmataceae bacterium]VTU02456.1 unnamed protein product [Gemmataceae bacterium]
MVTCPKCLSEAAVSLDLDDGDTLRCPECDEAYSVAEVVAVIQSWSKLLPWLLSHPARTPECSAVKVA